MKKLVEVLSRVRDPRTGNARLHNLLDLLVIALTASICGCDSCVDFADFAEDREALFREFLELPNGLPSHDTFSRLFRLLDPEALAAGFGAFVDELGEDGLSVVAIDGKTLRRSFDRAAGKSALHVVTAFGAGAGVALGQVGQQDGENEIVAARRLLAAMDLKGALVTGDAIHCQAKTAAAIRERQGEWLFSLKKNRPATYAAVEEWFADPHSETLKAHVSVDGDHGRIETRQHDVTHDVSWLWPDTTDPDNPPMPGVAMLGRVRVQVEKDGAVTTSTRYYLASVPLSPETFARAVRAHWAIESKLHWVLDMAFDEDRARNRKDHGPANLAIIRKLALNTLRKARPDISIRRKRKRSGWSDAFARSIIGQMR